MAWENPKTNWGQPGQTVPGVDDFNRIEGNINELNEKKVTANHSHGNITSDGKIGSTANLPVFTGTNGVLGTKTAANARVALGLGSVATENTLPVRKGGTGATTAAQALSNLGLKFFRYTDVLDMGDSDVSIYTGLPATYRYISHSIINSPVYPVKSISLNNFVDVWFNQSAPVDNTAIDIVIVAFQIN